MSIFKHCIGEACWKYFVGYVNHFNNQTKPVLMKLSKSSGSVKSFEKVKLYYLCLKKNKDILNEYAEIWNSIKDLIGKCFDVEVIHCNKYKSAKIKSFNDEIRTAFHDEGLTAEETPRTAHSIILVDSIYRRNKSYYPQVILEECKYMVKNETTERYITENLFDSDSYFNCNSGFGS